MNKKILAKTLLPISAIALLGGGIASSLTLTSCSKKQNFSILEHDVFNSKAEIYKYINEHSSHPTVPSDLNSDDISADSSSIPSSGDLQGGAPAQTISFSWTNFNYANDGIDITLSNEFILHLDVNNIHLSSPYAVNPINLFNDGQWQPNRYNEYFAFDTISGNPTLSFANYTTHVVSYTGREWDNVHYSFAGWGNSEKYHEDVWNFYLNNVTLNNSICNLLYNSIDSIKEDSHSEIEVYKYNDRIRGTFSYFDHSGSFIESALVELNNDFYIYNGSTGIGMLFSKNGSYTDTPFHTTALNDLTNRYDVKNCGNFVTYIAPAIDSSLNSEFYKIKLNTDNGNAASFFIF